MDRERVHASYMLSTISAGWAIPQVISRQLEAGEGLDQEHNPIVGNSKSITIPKITLSNVNLTYAINFLSDASVRFDFEIRNLRVLTLSLSLIQMKKTLVSI